jgi:adenine-specific DNA methylase
MVIFTKVDGIAMNFEDFPEGFGNVSAIHAESIIGVPSLVDEQSGLKRQKTTHEESLTNMDDFDIYHEAPETNMLLPEMQDVNHQSIIEFDNIEEIVEGNALTNNSVKTLHLLEEKCQAGGSFFELASGSTRSVAAKLFFELLVLKTRDLITVDQKSEFGDIHLGIKAV